MNDILLNDDISFKLLYQIGNDNLAKKDSLTIKNVLDHIPGVQIREFLPDTRLDQCINLFSDMMSNVMKLAAKSSKDVKDNPENKSEENRFKDFSTKLLNTARYAFSYFVGGTNPDFLDDVKIGSDEFTSYNFANDSGQKIRKYVMDFPFSLYYRLQSCVTTNIYEIPAIDTDKRIMSSSGQKGWGDSSTGFRVTDFLGKIPLIGDLAKNILGNVGINYMPWWNAESGSATTEPVVNLKFDLFNDSLEAALYNFIFVNTLVPNNKWIQYNMFQHSSNLYDVKIEGINRLYACSGDFTVTYGGVLRDPPNEFINRLVPKHANKNMSPAFKNNILNNKLIKIPDVYHVSMAFQSLLPANFNNYIFNFAQNSNHITKYDKDVYQQSDLAKVLPVTIATAGERFTKFWNEASNYDAALSAASSVKRDQIEKRLETERSAQKAQWND